MLKKEKDIDQYWMQQAISLAETAAKNDEVPVGALLLLDNKVISEGWNRPISTHDPTAHAEIIVLREAAASLKNYRLLNTTLYTTLEPCVMCLGAIVHARIRRVVFGAYDPKSGAVCSALSLEQSKIFNHQVNYLGGVMAEECGSLLGEFFASRRH